MLYQLIVLLRRGRREKERERRARGRRGGQAIYSTPIAVVVELGKIDGDGGGGGGVLWSAC